MRKILEKETKKQLLACKKYLVALKKIYRRTRPMGGAKSYCCKRSLNEHRSTTIKSSTLTIKSRHLIIIYLYVKI